MNKDNHKLPTFAKKSKKRNWRRIMGFVILVGVVAYSYGEPHLERILGVDLPSIRDQGRNGQVADADPSFNGERPNASDPSDQNRDRSNPTFAKRGGFNNGSISNGSKSGGSAKSNPYLTPTGKKSRLQSPAGLVYGVGGGGEHRVDHVMRHANDMPSRPVHSVFEGSEDEILRMLDEAFELVKSNSNRVRNKPDRERNYRVAHVVDMQRKIGYLGGKRGKRENYPPRSKLTLVIDNEKFVITAYPDK